MIKHFYFGLMSTEEALETSGAFFFADKYWNFCMEVNFTENYIRITDTVGRIMPIDQTHVGDLQSALDEAVSLQADYDDILTEMDYFGTVMPEAGFVSQGFIDIIVTSKE